MCSSFTSFWLSELYELVLVSVAVCGTSWMISAPLGCFRSTAMLCNTENTSLPVSLRYRILAADESRRDRNAVKCLGHVSWHVNSDVLSYCGWCWGNRRSLSRRTEGPTIWCHHLPLLTKNHTNIITAPTARNRNKERRRLTWSLHFDHLCSQISEDHGGEGTSQDSKTSFNIQTHFHLRLKSLWNLTFTSLGPELWRHPVVGRCPLWKYRSHLESNRWNRSYLNLLNN